VGGRSNGTVAGVMASGKCDDLPIQYGGEGSKCMIQGGDKDPFQLCDPMLDVVHGQGIQCPNGGFIDCVVVHWLLCHGAVDPH